MNQKGLDVNFFIGMFLIFGLLLWFNVNQVPTQELASIDIDTDIHKQVESVDFFHKENVKNQANNSRLVPEDSIQLYELSNDYLKIIISNHGASVSKVFLNDYYTYDSLELKLVDSLDFNLSFFHNQKLINTNQIVFNEVVKIENQLSFTFKDEINNSITLIYELLPDSYQLNCKVVTDNYEGYLEPHKLTWSQIMPQLEKNIDNERNVTTINYSFNNKSSKQLSLMKDSEKILESPNWIANRQQFFSTILYSDNIFNSTILNSNTPSSNDYVKKLNSEFTINYDNQSSEYVFDMYFLPNKYSLLSSYDKGFESLVPLGWGVFGWVNKFLVIPMFNFLEDFGLNYGLIILIIALVIKFILFLPTRASYLSMAKMRVLKPEIDAINEKVKDPMERQQAHMNLYRKTGVNPLGGCLPLLLQMPILIALFRFFPASIELRQQPFLWADDLSSYDSILDLGFSIPLYGDHISLFALLMTFATVLQMIYSNQMSANNAQMPQMKYVMYTMPIIFLFVMNNYSSALSYYYFLANLITFGQQLVIRSSINDDKLYAMLQANKKKPRQKSNFQKKIEEIAKKNQNK